MHFGREILVLLISFVVYIPVSQGDDYSQNVVTMIEELGFGSRGVTHYLKKLLEGCDNVGDLNNWILFMESYLACEDAAWPDKFGDNLLKTELEILGEFCQAWPNRRKCSVQLARKLNFCLGTSSENGRKGSNALRFSDSYARFICQNKRQFLNATIRHTPGTRRSLQCFTENSEKIKQCAELKGSLLPVSNICSNMDVVQDCLRTNFETSCPSPGTTDWVRKLVRRLKDDFHC